MNRTFHLKVPFFSFKWDVASGKSVAGLFLLALVLIIAIWIGMVYLVVWAINDIMNHGAHFWNVAAILLVLAGISDGNNKKD